MVMSNIKLNVEVERKYLMKKPPRVDTTQIGSKTIQLELRNISETLQEIDDIDTMSESIAYMIQQSATRKAKETNKPLKIS